MDSYAASLSQAEWKECEKFAIDYLVSQPTPIINGFRNLNRNILHRVLNQLTRIPDIHVQSLFLALLTDYIVCDCREMDIGVSGEWTGSWNKNTVQLLSKLSSIWSTVLYRANEVLSLEQYQAQVDILERSVGRLIVLEQSAEPFVEFSWYLRDSVQFGKTIIKRKFAAQNNSQCDVSDFVVTTQPKTPAQSKGSKSTQKRTFSQTQCLQPTSKHSKLSTVNLTYAEFLPAQTSSLNTNFENCELLKKMLCTPASDKQSPCKSRLPWDVISDSEDDSWLMESPLGIPRKLQLSPATSSCHSATQKHEVIKEMGSPSPDDVISISDDSNSIEIIKHNSAKTVSIVSNNSRMSKTIDCSFLGSKPVSSGDQENQRSFVKIAYQSPVKQLNLAPLKELTNTVSAVTSGSPKSLPQFDFSTPVPVSGGVESNITKLSPHGLKESSLFIEEVTKQVTKENVSCSDKPTLNLSTKKKSFLKKVSSEEVSKFKTGNVVNAFALMMSQAKKLT